MIHILKDILKDYMKKEMSLSPKNLKEKPILNTASHNMLAFSDPFFQH